MSELLELASSIVDRAEGSETVEAFLTHEKEFQVKVYSGEVDSLSSAEPRGAGIRVIESGRVGFAYTTDLGKDGINEVVARARSNAAHTTPDDAVGLAEPWSHEPEEVSGLFDSSAERVDPDTKVAFALELERATASMDDRIRAVEEASYSDSSTEIALATSTGVAGYYRRSDAWCYAIAIATDGDDTEVGFEFDLARVLTDLDAESVAKRAAQRALQVLGAAKIPSARMPVLLDPYTAGQFLGVIGSALTGEAVQKGRSLFAGKVGEQVAGARLTLVDNGRAAGAPGSSPWDDEGVPTQRTEVIRDGVLTSFLYDLTSARREQRRSTGNASRAGFKSPPGPSPSNLAFEATVDSPEELLRATGQLLLVQDFHGVHSGANPVSGDFSVGATGRLYENGSPGAPVKEVTIAAPMLEILSGIEGVAGDRRWLPFGGSYGGASTLIAEVTVGGL